MHLLPLLFRVSMSLVVKSLKSSNNYAVDGDVTIDDLFRVT